MARVSSILFGAALLAGHAVQAQTGDIPEEVIAECNAEASASELPDCLKSGAIAHEMLALAQDEDLYGEKATRVIDICGKQNDGYDTTWICFRNAAESAVEARELIGADAISDTCIAGISDPETYERLDATYRQERSERFPDERFFGGTMYHQFRGCPEEAAEAGSETGDMQDGPTAISSRGCAAYSELEEVVAGNDADTLLAMIDRLESMDEPGPSDFSDVTGVTREGADFLYDEADGSEPEEEGMRTAALLGAFLQDSHPQLLEDFFEHVSGDQPSGAGDFADEMAQGFFMMLVESAYDVYRDQCQ